MKTNVEILRDCFEQTNDAQAQVTTLQQAVDNGAVISATELVAEITTLRNTLRAAFCAAQELKTRTKKKLKHDNTQSP
jgi:phage terminase Nu1 subunit (DNA packaging protein)